jgi:hypothetical protein
MSARKVCKEMGVSVAFLFAKYSTNTITRPFHKRHQNLCSQPIMSNHSTSVSKPQQDHIPIKAQDFFAIKN